MILLIHEREVEERYLNLCLLTVETVFDEYYEKGEFYWFDEETEVEIISQEKLKKLLDK